MSADPWPSETVLPLRITRQIDAACDEFEAALRNGGGLSIVPYLSRVEAAGREVLVEELAQLAFARLRETGTTDPIASLIEANPSLRQELNRIQLSFDGASTARMTGGQSSERKSGLVIRCPHCHC